MKTTRIRPSTPGGSPGLLAREFEDTATASTGAAVTCQGCKYPNRVSQAFFTLSVRNLYCRRCGRMIDREGRETSPA